MLHGTLLKEAVVINEYIKVISTIEDMPFMQSQIGEDSIDLRLGNYGYIMNNKFEYINTLSNQDFEKYYDRVEIPSQGYLLKPNQILFAPTLERVKISKNLYFGNLTGRSVFARMGLSIHCTQSKFTAGMDSVISLQIKNNNDKIGLKIYPFQKVAQLLIEEISAHREENYESNSQYRDEKEYKYPKLSDKDWEQYSDRHVKNLIWNDQPNLNLTLLREDEIEKMKQKERILNEKIKKYENYAIENLAEYKAAIVSLIGFCVSITLSIIFLPKISKDLIVNLSGAIVILIIFLLMLGYVVFKFIQVKKIKKIM